MKSRLQPGVPGQVCRHSARVYSWQGVGKDGSLKHDVHVLSTEFWFKKSPPQCRRCQGVHERLFLSIHSPCGAFMHGSEPACRVAFKSTRPIELRKYNTGQASSGILGGCSEMA